jgi:hypothetical protein
MTPSERRAACLRLLAKLDQKIAKCEVAGMIMSRLVLQEE